MSELIKKITAVPEDFKNTVITVVTKDITFREKVDSFCADTSVKVYEGYDNESELYTHMVYVRLCDEFEKLCEEIVAANDTLLVSVKTILKENAMRVAIMQSILNTVEENNLPAGRALQLLDFSGNLMHALYQAVDEKGCFCEPEAVYDMIAFDNRVARITRRRKTK